jgi:hypothetical protein
MSWWKEKSAACLKRDEIQDLREEVKNALRRMDTIERTIVQLHNEMQSFRELGMKIYKRQAKRDDI